MTDIQIFQALFWFLCGYLGVAASIGLIDAIQRYARDTKKDNNNT